MFKHHRSRTHSFKTRKRLTVQKVLVLLLLILVGAILYSAPEEEWKEWSRFVFAPAPETTPESDVPQENSEALPTTTLTIQHADGTVSIPFSVEVAATDATRERGLMFRKNLDEAHGMMLLMPFAQNVSIWMKDTPLSLDILFVRADGEIDAIFPDATPYSVDPIPSSSDVLAVVEFAAGTAKKYSLQPGDRIVHAYFNSTVQPVPSTEAPTTGDDSSDENPSEETSPAPTDGNI